MYQESKRELDSAHAAKEELQKQIATLKDGAAQQSANKEGGLPRKPSPR
jgi:cell division protein FtsB